MQDLYKRCNMVLLVLLCSASLQAQPVEHLFANNVDAVIGIGGNLFSSIVDTNAYLSAQNTYALFEAPKGLGPAPIFTSTLWLSGADGNSLRHCAAQRYKSGGGDYSDGPIALHYDSAYDNYYQRVFKVTRTQINQHVANNFPVLMQTVDSSLLKWPGKGNAYVMSEYGVDITDDLAHFIDANGNGIYDPWNGDYPALCGDEGIFFVFNDIRQTHNESGSTALGVEVRGMAEVYYRTTGNLLKEPVNNSVFVSYEIENKSSYDYHDFYIGCFEDPDLGCFTNDRVGCDTLRNMMFVYNGTNSDNDCNGVKGYAPYQAAFGTVLLNRPMAAFGYFVNGAIETPDYFSCPDVTNYLHGKWHDGSPFTIGGTGFNGAIPTNFLFPGNPNDSSSWSEVGPGVVLTSGDRRMFSSIGAMNFAPGETKALSVAYLLSFDSSATKFSIVDTLKRDADSIQEFYNSVFKPCHTANTILSNSAPELRTQLFPNPSDGYFTIKGEGIITDLQLYDLSGHVVLEWEPKTSITTINLRGLAKGIYMLKVSTAAGSTCKKLVFH